MNVQEDEAEKEMVQSVQGERFTVKEGNTVRGIT